MREEAAKRWFNPDDWLNNVEIVTARDGDLHLHAKHLQAS
jgi:hypothetical protein